MASLEIIRNSSTIMERSAGRIAENLMTTTEAITGNASFSYFLQCAMSNEISSGTVIPCEVKKK